MALTINQDIPVGSTPLKGIYMRLIQISQADGNVLISKHCYLSRDAFKRSEQMINHLLPVDIRDVCFLKRGEDFADGQLPTLEDCHNFVKNDLLEKNKKVLKAKYIIIDL